MDDEGTVESVEQEVDTAAEEVPEVTTVGEEDESHEETTREAAEAAWDEHSGEAENTDSEEPEDDAPVEEPIEYPSGWSDEIKEKMAEVPRDVQEFLADHTKSQQASYTQKMQELSRVQTNYEGLAKTIQPYEEFIAEDGETIDQRVGELLQLDMRLDNDPITALKQLCAECEIDPRQLIGSSGNGSDPQLNQQATQYQIAAQELAQRQEALEQKLAQQEQASAIAHADTVVAEWASETDSEGNVLRPYYNQLQEQMVPIITAMRTEDPNASYHDLLQKSYDKVYKTFSSLQSEATEKVKAKTAKAKVSASKAKGVPGGAVKTQKKEFGTTREAAEAAWDEHTQ